MKTPNMVALELVELVIVQEQITGKKFSRFQMSGLSLRRIAGLNFFSTGYQMLLHAELMELGWTMLPIDDTGFGFIKLSSCNSWTKFSSKMVEKLN